LYTIAPTVVLEYCKYERTVTSLSLSLSPADGVGTNYDFSEENRKGKDIHLFAVPEGEQEIPRQFKGLIEDRCM
jgi:hypothetical protein